MDVIAHTSLPKVHAVLLNVGGGNMAHAKITKEWLIERVLLGYGCGHGADYKPWLTLGRGSFIPKSRHGWYRDPATGAQRDVFSDNENDGGIVGVWLGAIDRRVQYPCFPFRHPHPLEDAPGRNTTPLPWSKGTLALAHEARLRHPVFVGTDIAFVLTLDSLFTLPPRTTSRVAAMAAKHKDITRGDDPEWNVVENLELQRLYARDIDARFFLWDQLVCPTELIKNLRSIYSSAALPSSLRCSPFYPTFLKFTEQRVQTWPVNRILQAFSHDQDLQVPEVTFLWDHAVWTQHIPSDLTKPIVMSRPAPLWDGRWMKEMRAAMFGCTEF